MIKRKAGVNVKISDVFKKRALVGAAIFCITAIATVGALSIGGNEEENTPDSLVDLNEMDSSGKDLQQTADAGKETDPSQTAGVSETDAGEVKETDPSQVAGISETEPGEVKEADPSQVAEITGTEPGEAAETDPAQVAEMTGSEETDPEPAEVLSPQLIAEQLNFDKSMGLLWPVQGEVVIPYSPGHGVYHYTLDQFGTSEALVLSSMVGTEVKAAAKGVVTAIEEDSRTGTTVKLALGNDTTLVYGQLDVTDLKEGDVVEAGECLGTVAEPTRYYVVEGPNLYFQVLEGEAAIDPSMLLREE